MSWLLIRRTFSERQAYRPVLEPVEDRLVPSPLEVFPVPLERPVQHVVRTYYLIPSNRQPQPRAVESLRHSVLSAQAWYRDLLERNGFGPKTFTVETEWDGVTPRIHVIHAPETDEFYRADPWRRVNQAASAAGLPIWGRGQVWFAYFEGHQMNPDGSVIGGFAGGSSFGSGSDGGVAMLGSSGLATLLPEDLTEDQPYDGRVRATLGPYPMRQNVTYPWFEGQTFSSISSSHRGAALHELGHAFGLPHDFRNDANFHGNLLGNGLRGFRGWAHPDRYPADDVHLAYGSALALNVSRYFSPRQVYSDQVRPTLTLHTAGDVDPVNGQLEIHFTAADNQGLAAAFLQLGGERVAELPLQGASVEGTFVTPYYTPDQANNFTITLLDAEGNRQNGSTSITPASGFNRAPRPFLKISPTQASGTQPVLLDASRSSDPDHPASSLLVEWDLDGDGTFDTEPTTEKTLQTTFSEAGTRLISVRVTDPQGAQSISAPLGIRIRDGGGAPGGGSFQQPFLVADLVSALLGTEPKARGGR